MRWTVFFLCLLGLDITSKIWAVHELPLVAGSVYPFGGIGVFSAAGVTFSLNLITNTGAAWGVLSGYGGMLFAIRCFVIALLLWYGRKKIAMQLVATGAIGNVIDYCMYGHVIDFLHFTFWGYEFPIFNLADSCICIGVALLLWTPKPRFVEI